MTITVTGSTGGLGGRVARHLAGLKIPQRLLVRDPARAPQLLRADIVQTAYRDGEASRRALAGTDVLFMVSAAEAPNRVAEHVTFIDAAVAAGVSHIVYTSFLAAAPDAVFTLGRDHHATEEHIRASGIPFTFLRDNLYADFVPFMVGEDGAIRGPAGDGRVSLVARDDIADVATLVVQDASAHAGATYEMTGPEALSLDDVATILTVHAGKPVRYERETVAEAYASRAKYGAPDWQVEAWVSTYTSIATGQNARVSEDIERLTGHEAISLAQVLHRSE